MRYSILVLREHERSSGADGGVETCEKQAKVSKELSTEACQKRLHTPARQDKAIRESQQTRYKGEDVGC